MYTVRVYKKHRTNIYFIVTNSEDLFELVSMLENDQEEIANFPYYRYTVTTMWGSRTLPNEFGWGDLLYWRM